MGLPEVSRAEGFGGKPEVKAVPQVGARRACTHEPSPKPLARSAEPPPRRSQQAVRVAHATSSLREGLHRTRSEPARTGVRALWSRAPAVHRRNRMTTHTPAGLRLAASSPWHSSRRQPSPAEEGQRRRRCRQRACCVRPERPGRRQQQEVRRDPSWHHHHRLPPLRQRRREVRVQHPVLRGRQH